jgi:hypothetical protein
VRRSAEAFYAAETDLNAIQAEWNDTLSTLDDVTDTLSAGGTVDLGTDTLPSGATYRSSLTRIDDGAGDAMFFVEVTAEDASQMGGERAVSMIIVGVAGGAGLGSYTLGKCCHAAATTRGETRLKSESIVDGNDFGAPPGWDGSRCDAITPEDKPGLMIGDLDDLVDNDEDLLGVPPLVEEPMTDADFNNFGGLSYDSLRSLATVVFEDPGHVDAGTASDEYGPRYLGDGSCDYDHPMNLGAMSGPCADHFPIIHCKGDCQFQGADGDAGYLQGIIIMDKDHGVGGELDFEKGAVFAGLIVGMGCVQVQEGSEVYGGLYVDGTHEGFDSCNGDPPLEVKDDWAKVMYSTCAIQRALEGTGVGELADTTSTGAAFRKLSNRSFAEILR